MTLKADLRRFITQRLPTDGAAVDVGDDTSLIDAGILDSMGLMELLHFLEDHTGLRIPDQEVTIANFQTVQKIEALVERLRSSQSGRPPAAS